MKLSSPDENIPPSPCTLLVISISANPLHDGPSAGSIGTVHSGVITLALVAKTRPERLRQGYRLDRKRHKSRPDPSRFPAPLRRSDKEAGIDMTQRKRDTEVGNDDCNDDL